MIRNEKSEQFDLMHKDDMVCTLHIDPEIGSIQKVGEIIHEALLPPGGNISTGDLKKWWQMRAVPMKQGDIEHALRHIGVPTGQLFLTRNLGLSLTDHYWMRPHGTKMKWEEVSLFSNHFHDMVGDFQFSHAGHIFSSEGSTGFAPSASTQGELKKKWVADERGKRFLIKGNKGASCQQSLNEVLATEIHKRQGRMPFAEYRMIELETKGLGSGCITECFTSEKLEFISAYQLVSSQKKPNDRSYYEHFIALCRKHGLDADYAREFLEYQIMTDFVISNTDRHFNNFGVLRDTDTLKIVDVAPIFDSGNSMFFQDITIPDGEELYSIATDSFKGTELELLSYVQNRSLVNREYLPDGAFIKELYKRDNMPEERIQAIIGAYLSKMDMLHTYRNRKKLISAGQAKYGKPPRRDMR